MSTLKVNQILPFSGTGIGIGGVNSESSALLNIQSSTQGLLFPSMTTVQRSAIVNPKDGLVIYNTDIGKFEYYKTLNSIWQTMGGIERINNLSAKDQFLSNGTSGLSPNWTTSNDDTNILNIPSANGNSVTAGLISNDEYNIFNNKLNSTKNTLHVTKNAILSPSQYNSLQDALESITDASPTNPYVIYVYPGIYQEPSLNISPYITIQGVDANVCVLQALSPNTTFLTLNDLAILKNLTITGASGSNGIGVYFEGATSEGTLIKDCIFSNCTTCIECYGNLSPTYLTVSNCFFFTAFTTGVLVHSNSGITSEALLINITVKNLEAPFFDDFVLVHGNDSVIVIDGTQIFATTVSNGIRAYNGATIQSSSFHADSMSKGVLIENVGDPCELDLCGYQGSYNVNDIVVEHPTTSGSICGNFEIDKTTINSPNISLFDADPTDGITFTGDFSFGPTFSQRVSVKDLLIKTPSMGVLEGGLITLVSDLTVNISAGNGYTLTDDETANVKIIWDSTDKTLASNSINYIFYTNEGLLSTSSSFPDTRKNILLGRVVTNGSSIILIDSSQVIAKTMGNLNDNFVRNALGSIFKSGTIVTENITPFLLNISNGIYYFGHNAFSPSGGMNIGWTSYYKSLTGWNQVDQSVVDNLYYDDGSGTLASIPSGKYVKHSLYLIGDGSNEKYFLVYGQELFDDLILAESGNLPIPPSYFEDGVVLIASLIVNPSGSNIDEIRDERPVIGFKASGVSASVYHGNLLGLLNDDHPQYLKTDGSRVLTGDQDFGGFSITNINNINSVNILAHATRHLPNGSDPLTTAGPTTSLSATTSNSTGIANSLSRSDHIHSILSGTPSTQTPDQTNSTGTSANLARADHIHNIPTAAPSISLSATTTNSQGISTNFARSDHQHQITTGVPSSIIPDQTNSTGTSSNIARSDHTHNVSTDTPITINTSNLKGSSTSFSRADHQHSHGNQTDPNLHSVSTSSANGFMSSTDKSKLDGIGGNRIIKSGIIPGSSFSGNPKTYPVVFGTNFPLGTDYSININSQDGRTWTYSSKTISGFVINSNANATLTGEVSWTAINVGETVE